MSNTDQQPEISHANSVSGSIIDEYDDYVEARSIGDSTSPRSPAFSPTPADRSELTREFITLKAENERIRGDNIRLRADEKRALDLCDESKQKLITSLAREDELQKSLDKVKADLLSANSNISSITSELDISKAKEKRLASAITVLEETITKAKTDSKDELALAEKTFASKMSALEAKNEAVIEDLKANTAIKLSNVQTEAQKTLLEAQEQAEARLNDARAAHSKELNLQRADTAEKIKTIEMEAVLKLEAFETAAKSSSESLLAKLRATQDEAQRAADTAAAKLSAAESAANANLEAKLSEAASKLSYSESLARVASSEATAMISARDSTISSLRDGIADERDQRKKLNAELDATRESLAISETNLVTAKETIRLIELARDTVVANQEAEIARLRKGLDEEISKLAEEKRLNEEYRIKMLADFQSAQAEHQATKIAFAVDHEAMKKALLADHERSVESLLSGHDSYKKSLLAEHDATTSGLQAKIDSLSSSLHSANVTIENRDSTISHLQVSLKKSEEMYSAEVILKETSNTALSDSEATVVEHKKMLEELNTRHSSALTKIDNLTGDLERTRSRCTELSNFLVLAKSASEGARDSVIALQQIENTEANFETTTLSKVRPAGTLEETYLRKEEAVSMYEEEVSLHSRLVDSAIVSLAQVVSLLNNDLDGIISTDSTKHSSVEANVNNETNESNESSTLAVDSVTAIAVISRLLHKTVTDTARERAIRYARASEVSDMSIVDSLRERRKMLLKIRSRVFESVMKSATVRSDSSPSISAVRMAETVSDALLEFIAVMDKAVRDMGVLLPEHDLEEIELGIGVPRVSGNGETLFSPQPPPVPSSISPSSRRLESSPLSTRSSIASSLLLPETPLGAITPGRSLARSRSSRASSVTLASPRRFCGAAGCMREHKHGISEQTYASVRTFAKKTVSATATEKLLHSSAAGYSPSSWSNRVSSQIK